MQKAILLKQCSKFLWLTDRVFNEILRFYWQGPINLSIHLISTPPQLIVRLICDNCKTTTESVNYEKKLDKHWKCLLDTKGSFFCLTALVFVLQSLNRWQMLRKSVNPCTGVLAQHLSFVQRLNKKTNPVKQKQLSLVYNKQNQVKNLFRPQMPIGGSLLFGELLVSLFLLEIVSEDKVNRISRE